MRQLSVKHLVVAAVALVFGLGLGGLGPRAEVRLLRAQLEKAQEEACDDGQMGREIARVFQGRPWEVDDATRARDALPEAEQEPDGADEAAGEASDEGAPDPEGFRVNWKVGDDGEEFDRDAFEDNMEMAREAMVLRQTQARAALLEDADLDDEQLDRVDGVIDQMNDDLVGLARDLVDTVNTGEEPSRRDAMLFAAETLDVLLTAEEQFADVFTEEQLAGLQEESKDPMAYVDPVLMDVLMELDR